MGRGKRRKKRLRRPTGTIKDRNIQLLPSGMPVIGDPLVLKFPEDKEAAEEMAMRGLIAALRADEGPFRFSSFTRHPQPDGPDFEIEWNGHRGYIELTELAPLRGPYSTAKRVFTVAEMARCMEQAVNQKQQKYLARPHRPLFLLIYVTDDAFYITEEVLAVFAYRLRGRKDIIFEAVFYLAFWADGRPCVRVAYPLERDISQEYVERVLDQQVINPDTDQYRVIEEDPATNSLVIRQYLPRGADMNRLVDSIKAMLPGIDRILGEKSK